MRTLNEILAEMKVLVEELESIVGSPAKNTNDNIFIDNYKSDNNFILSGAMDETINFDFAAAQPTLNILTEKDFRL